MSRRRSIVLAASTLAAAAVSVFVSSAHAQMLDSGDDGLVWGSSHENPPLMLDSAHAGCGKACRAFHLADHGWQPGQMLPGARTLRGPGPTDPTDVLHNNLSVEVSPPTRFIAGSNTMTIRSNVNGLSSFVFRLRSNFTVSLCEVTDSVGAYSVTPVMAASGYGRTITLARPINAGQTFTVRVVYEGAPPNLSFGNFFARTQNNVAGAPGVICTLSEPYYAGTWWPCKDGDVLTAGDNADKATLTIAITAPDTFASTSNGVLTGVTVPVAGKKTYTYATSYPMATYNVCFSTTVYNTWTATYTYPGGTMPMPFMIYPSSDTPTRRTAWEQAGAIMAALRPVFGEYPFVNEKYGIYQFEFGGGMEHQTNSGQGGGSAWNESLTAHELGHQWWGDDITCRTWADIWLNEGFATYAEALWLERKPGSTGLAALKTAMAARRPANLTLSVYCTDVTNVNRIFSGDASYDKGAWVVHQFRHIVGDTQFAAILAAYRAAYSGSAATTADFVALASSVAGQNLDWYFNPWIYGIGAPAYDFAWHAAVIDGRNYLRLMIRQTQQGPNPTYPLFTMPIDVRITTGAGTFDTVVRNDATTDYFLIPLAAAPTGVAIDPDDWILNTGKASVAYTDGPPKVVSATPAPGSTIAHHTPPTALRIGFSDSVNASAPAFAVTRVGIGTVPFNLSFDPATFVATLSFSAALAPGTYSVAVNDFAVTSIASGQILDGELATNSAAGFPSGDGQPGGPLAFTFTVEAPPPACVADFNNSGQSTIDDLFLYFNAYFSGQPTADINGTGGVSIDDLFLFINAWFIGC